MGLHLIGPSYFSSKISCFPGISLRIFALLQERRIASLQCSVCDMPLLRARNADSYFKCESQLRTAKSIFLPPHSPKTK